MTHFDLAEARTMARKHRAATPYDQLAIKLLQACEEIERLRQMLKDVWREPCLCCQESGCQFGCRCMTDERRAALEAHDD